MEIETKRSSESASGGGLGPSPCWASSCGRAVLYNGDCERLRELGALRAEALISDPPYGIGYCHGGGGRSAGISSPESAKRNTHTRPICGDDKPFDPRPWTSAGYRKILLFGANHYAQRVPEGGEWLVWDKSCGQGAHTTFRDAEFAWCSVKTPRNIYRHLWLGCVRTGEERKAIDREKKHPSQKPVALMLWAMESARVAIGSTVCDPYMGSGSTGVACLRTGRKFIGVEIDPAHFETARARIERELSQCDLFRMPNVPGQVSRTGGTRACSAGEVPQGSD